MSRLRHFKATTLKLLFQEARARYDKVYRQSLTNTDVFWREAAEKIVWVGLFRLVSFFFFFLVHF